MNKWPDTVSEEDTLDEVLKGRCFSRFGDGELKACFGGNCISQIYDEKLAKEMLDILKNPHPNCIVGIPPYRPDSPKEWFWGKIWKNQRYINTFNPDVKYYSQFVTRPDNAPWINNEQFWKKIISLWKGQHVTLVAGSARSLVHAKMPSVRSVTVVEALYRDSYRIIDRLEEEVMAIPNKVVLLCCGCTATCLANRLAAQGKWAIDLGHLGMYEKEYLKYDTQHKVP